MGGSVLSEEGTEQILFNGINASSGEYLFGHNNLKQLAMAAKGHVEDPWFIKAMEVWLSNLTGFMGPIEGINPMNLAETGWGVIFAHNADPGIRQALSELLEHRRKEASQQDERCYREYSGIDGYYPGNSLREFLSRHGAGSGADPVNPIKAPYYLLLVGDPEAIPYQFQYQLDVQYAVGRIHFDSLDEYARYAHKVVEAESSQIRSLPQVVLFGVSNEGDQATRLSADHLVKPLAASLTKSHPHCMIHEIVGEDATKSRLVKLLRTDEPLAFLFTASHGMGFPIGHPKQLVHQGALLCQDWPGPLGTRGPIPEDFYFSADDVMQDMQPPSIVFHFACYSAGTPLSDEFSFQTYPHRLRPVAKRPFLSQLPLRLLSHPSYGGLAVVGHVERAWGYSFMWPKSGEQVAVFESALNRLLKGHPIGSAMEPFNQRYAALSVALSDELQNIRLGKTIDDRDLVGIWTATNDARSYIVLGDPAVRLMS